MEPVAEDFLSKIPKGNSSEILKIDNYIRIVFTGINGLMI